MVIRRVINVAILVGMLAGAPLGLQLGTPWVVLAAPVAAQHARPISDPLPLPIPIILPVLAAARAIELDMSSADALMVLRAANFSIEQEVDLPPDGLNRLIMAVPEDDQCMPRGARFVCPSIRVVLQNDPQRGPRVVRVEAFQTLAEGYSAAEMFAFAIAAVGPPLQTEMASEQVRGGLVAVWRQRWRDGLTDGALTEMFVTQDGPFGPLLGLPDPHAPATGVGTLRADEQAEDALTAVRRRMGGR